MMMKGVEPLIVKYPSSFGKWANVYVELNQGIGELIVVGKHSLAASIGLFQSFVPNKVVVIGEEQTDQIPLLDNRPMLEQTQFHVCQNYACSPPVYAVEDALKLLLTKSFPV
jgi:uncharacterized protein YyaL (SSP411 family)